MPIFSPRRSNFPKPLRRTALVALVLASLGGCASGIDGAPAGDSPVKSLLRAGNFVTDPPKPKDFVEKTRPPEDKLNYIPVHQRPAARLEPVLTAAGVKAQENQLDAVRKQHDRISGRPVVPVTATKPKKHKPKPDAAPAAT